ncbi:RnfABCDGE type electron transport complex subunit D [Aestuariibacter salexigens]|uniref:RnfABCDGE type electron transport complex subunit D n=1 Tax=Aestuariibacter salexigens TaxID=226010 RepID=UPI0003FAFA1F|nr:RnfABCDGE type electron transport complex subunit D [Aestuariibacter salexigens]
MSALNKTLQIRTSPHLTAGYSVDHIMRHVAWALLPTCGFAVFIFGLAALITLIVASLTCVLTEHVLCKQSGKISSVNDYSALVTGLLYGLTLPPGLPVWMVMVGAIIAIALGKFMFGGLGCNIFNPALVGRAFLQAAFPSAMTSWGPAMASERFSSVPSSLLAWPFQAPDYSSWADGVSSATPLALMKFEQQLTQHADLLSGMTTGSYGETCGVLILAGGTYLAIRKMLNWRIPLAIFVSAGTLSAICHYVSPELYPGAIFTLFSGGLMLGAVFMATDMVASPMTSKGVIVYGVLIGVLIVIIRNWGGLPEGVMYAILLANAASPHIDALTQPKVFGSQSKASSEGPE